MTRAEYTQALPGLSRATRELVEWAVKGGHVRVHDLPGPPGFQGWARDTANEPCTCGHGHAHHGALAPRPCRDCQCQAWTATPET